MDHLPTDPAILVSAVNMLLRDDEFDNLEQLCYHFGTTADALLARLRPEGYVYSEVQRQLRPEDYDAVPTAPPFTKDAVETAYAFFHQKERVYRYSTMAWQRDDIECAIADYADGMSPALLAALSGGRSDFLRSHATFGADLAAAVEALERML